MVSNNVFLDASTIYKNKLYVYKNFSTIDNTTNIQYINGSIDNNKFAISRKFDRNPKLLPCVSLLLKDEIATKENNNGNIYEIYAISIKFKNIYYIIGTILNSDIFRIVEYDMENQKQLSNYAENVVEKWKVFGKDGIIDIKTVFNLDPLNKLESKEPTMCFIYNSNKNKSIIRTTSQHINSCVDVNSKLCDKYEKMSDKVLNLLYVYININNVKNINKIMSVIYTGELLYIFKTDETNIYQNVEELKEKYNEFLELKSPINNMFTAINIHFNQNINKCISVPETKNNISAPIYIQTAMTELPSNVQNEKEERAKSSSNFGLIIGITIIILLILLFIYYKKIRK